MVWVLLINLAKGQVEESTVQEKVEQWAEQQEGGLDYLDMLEQIQFVGKRKLSINKANYEDWASLQLLTHAQIMAVLEHKRQYGDFVSIYELQVVEGLQKDLIRVLFSIVQVPESPFDFFRNAALIEEKWKGETVLLLAQRLEKSQGYYVVGTDDNPAFEGGPQRLVLRQRFSYKQRLFFGYNGEKDAGEAFFSGSNPQGFDFQSAHLFLKNPDKHVLRSLAIGDYQLELGQGLVFSSGLGFGKSPGLFAIKRNRFGLRPYRSLNEALFLRGIGMHWVYKKWHFLGFTSSQRIDARLLSNTLTDSLEIASLPISGLHRTAAEIAAKGQAKQQLLGGAVRYDIKGFSVCYTQVLSSLSLPLQANNQVYQVFQNRGGVLLQQGLSYSFLKNNWVVFGEIASNQSAQHLSMLHGAILSLGKKLDLLYYYRDFHKAYQAVFSNPVSEFSGSRNERGMMMGWSYKPGFRWLWNTYMDRFYAEWPRYRVDAPSQGLDFLSELSYTERKRGLIYVRWRTKLKEWNVLPTGAKTHELTAHQRHVLRFHTEFSPLIDWSIRMRVEWVGYRFADSDKVLKLQQGALVFVDIRRNWTPIKTTFTGRLQFFSVEDYNARVYAFENDVFYSFTIPAFQYSGWRYYWVSKTVVKRRWTIWTRWAQTRYMQTIQQGSGPDRLQARIFTDVKVQLRYVF